MRSFILILFAFVLALSLFDAPSLAATDPAEEASNFFLSVDKPIVGTKEATRITIRLKTAVTGTTADQQVEFAENVYASKSTSFSKLYDIRNWRIQEQGDFGAIASTDGDAATYVAPGTRPTQGFVTVAVDLVPKKPGHPSVTLLARIEVDDAATIFSLTCEPLGIRNELYVSRGTSDNAIAAALSKVPEEYRTMTNEQIKNGSRANGVDMNALMSAAKAVYSASEGRTAIVIELPRMNEDGKTVAAEHNVISIDFEGRGTGTFSVLPDEPEHKNGIALQRYSPTQTMGFVGQSVHYTTDADGNKVTLTDCPECRIVIEQYDRTGVKGHVHTEVDYMDNSGNLYRGTLSGRFSAALAN